MEKQTKTSLAMNQISLNKLLDTAEIKHMENLISQDRKTEIREYLNEPERKQRLSDKGVLADYLYYFLMYKIK